MSTTQPNKWRETTLGKEVTFQRGFDLPATERTEGSYPLMVSNGQDGFHSAYKVKAPGIVTGRSGTLGGVFYVTSDFWPLNTTLWVKDLHNNDIRFVYYLLKTLRLERYNAGSGVPTLNRNHLEHLPLQLPSSSEQREIAAVLSSLDDKIELLRGQNETLEQVAQAIFNEWFVKPTADGLLPKGWKSSLLGEFVDVERGLSYTGKGLAEDGMPLINLGNFNISGAFASEKIKHYKGDYRDRHVVKKGEILIANTDITQDKVVLGSPIFMPLNDDVLFTHHLYRVKEKATLSRFFLYQLFKTHSYRARVLGFATGTTVLALPKDAIADMPLALPTDDILMQFDALAEALYKKIDANNEQIPSLQLVRNALLPRLMSGKVRICQE